MGEYSKPVLTREPINILSLRVLRSMAEFKARASLELGANDLECVAIFVRLMNFEDDKSQPLRSSTHYARLDGFNAEMINYSIAVGIMRGFRI